MAAKIAATLIFAKLTLGMRVTVGLHANDTQGLASSNFIEPLRCPMNSGSGATKNYFFDLPGKEVSDSTAVHLIRDSKDPRLVIYKGSVWNIWQKLDGGRNLVGNVHFEAHTPKETGYTGAVKAEFNLLKDTIAIKRVVENGVAAFEFEHNRCSGPIRPTRFSLAEMNETEESFSWDEEEEEPTIDGPEDENGSLAELDETEGVAKGKGKGKKGKSSNSKSRGKGRGKGKGKKGGGKKGGKPVMGAGGPVRPSRGAFDCPMRFVGGTFYPAERVKRAMKKAASGATGERVNVIAGSTDEVSITPALAKAGSGILGAGGLGFLTIIPAVWLSAEQGVVFGPIGAGVGFLISGIIAMGQIKQAAHENRMTAAEKIFEKLWCMSYSKTCAGRPCFKRCTDAKGNLALVPTAKAGSSKLTCTL